MTEKRLNSSFLALIVVGVLFLSGLAVLSIMIDQPEVTATSTTKTPQPPSPPVCVSPQDGTKGITETLVTLQWQALAMYNGGGNSITNYLLHVGTSSPQNTNSAAANVFDANVGTLSSKTIQVEPGNTYYWAVRADDTYGSTWGATCSFSTNSPPDVTIDSIDPATPRANVEVTLKGTATDPDGDEIIAYKWESTMDGEIGTKATIVTELSSSDHIITFTAQDAYGTWSQPATYTIAVQIPNPPTKPIGMQPTETHDLKPAIRWNPSTDPDMDDIVYYISIGTSPGMEDIVSKERVETTSYKLTRSLEYETEKITAGRYVNEYHISLYAEDEYGTTSPVYTGSLNIVNSAPEKPTTTITPAEPYSSNYLTVQMTKPGSDDDGDEVQYFYRWYMDQGGGFMEQTVFEDQTTVPSRNTDVGEIWKVEAIPYDGIVEGDASYAQVEVVDAEPLVSIVNPESSDLNGDGMVDKEDNEKAGDDDGNGIPDNLYYVGESIRFDARDTVDPDEDQELSFTWDLGDDSDSLDGDRIKHTYNEPGEYIVTLSVDDGYTKVTNEDQDKTLILMVVYPPAALSIDFNQNPTKPYTAGDRVTVPLTVLNEGVGPASNVVVNISYLESGDLMTSRNFENILPGETKTISLEWRARKGSGLKVEVWARDFLGKQRKTSEEEIRPLVTEEEKRDAGSGESEGVAVGITAAAIIMLAILFLLLFIRRKQEKEQKANDDMEGKESEELDIRPQQPHSMLTATGYYAPSMPGLQQYPGLPGFQQPNGYNQGGLAQLPAAGTSYGSYQERRYYPLQSGYQQPYGPPIPVLPQPQQPPQPGRFSQIPEDPYRQYDPLQPEETTPNIEERPSSEPSQIEIKSKAEGPTCPHCNAPVEEGWLMCPVCKGRLM